MLLTGSRTSIDLEQLLKLRLAVARFGEMDSARWWNTQGVLGSRGQTVMKRGFPRTHRFTQARVVFAVARARCDEIFSPPNSVTLWNLPPQIEDELEDRWQHWLDDASSWEPFFETISDPPQSDLLDYLAVLGLVMPDQITGARALKRSHEGRAVALGTTGDLDDDLVVMLAAGFARGETGQLTVPYAHLEHE